MNSTPLIVCAGSNLLSYGFDLTKRLHSVRDRVILKYTKISASSVI
jgi:hypothetical protein